MSRSPRSAWSRAYDAAADALRLPLAMLCWNLSATRFRLRGARGPAPCQHPSDNGRAGETECEACLNWRSPARFARVCPLLRANPGGRPLCSVPAHQVRPFWGRFFVLAGIGSLSLYLAGSVVAVGVTRSRGIDLPWTTLVRPDHWRELRPLQARLFLRKGVEALRAGRTGEAFFSLNVAHDLEPGLREAAIPLAWLAQLSRPALADQLYAELIATAGTEAEAAALRDEWARALLARAELPTLARLSIVALGCSGPAAADSPWLERLLFAVEVSGDDAPLREALAVPGGLSPDVRLVIEHAAAARKLTPSEAALRLAAPEFARTASPVVQAYRVRELIRLGRGELALDVLANSTVKPAPLEAAMLRMEAFATLGWTSHRQALFASLLADPVAPVPELLDNLSAHLFRHPDPALIRELIDGYLATQPPLAAERHADFATLFLLAGRLPAGDPRVDRLGQDLTTIQGGNAAYFQRFAAALKSRETFSGVEVPLPPLRPVGERVSRTFVAACYRQGAEAAPEKHPRPPRPAT